MLHHAPFCQLEAAQNKYTVAQSRIEDRQLLPHKSSEHFGHGQTEKVNCKLFFSFNIFPGGRGVGGGTLRGNTGNSGRRLMNSFISFSSQIYSRRS